MSDPKEKPNSASKTSRASSQDRSLSQVISGRHLDDQYHGQQYSDPAPAPNGAEESQDVNEDDSDDLAPSEKDAASQAGPGSDEEVENNGEARDVAPVEKDLEAGQLNQTKTGSSRRSRARDPNLVTWDGPDDPENPKNWSIRRKWAATLVGKNATPPTYVRANRCTVSSFTFISPVSSSMVAPALGTLAKEFNVTNDVVISLMLSVFVLAYAIGPLFLGPLSEIYGRVIVLQSSNLLYLFFNLGCGLAQSETQMIIFRFLSGLGGSAPLAIGGGVLSDLFYAEQRGKAVSIYSLAPLLGPAVGPIAGGFITENTTWRWVFYATTIVDAVIQISGLFFLQETYPPVLLQRKKKKLIKETGNNDLHTEWDDPDRTLAKTLRISFIRPFKLLFSQVIIQCLAIYMAYLYGIMYLVLSTFPTLWADVYHESIGIGGLNYTSLGIGLFIGTQTCAPLQDRIYRVLKKRHGVGKPEFRVPLMIPGALCVPIGLFIYGWSAQAKTHWIVPNIGTAIFGAGIVTGFQCIQTYIVDSYTRYAASAIAATTVLRSLAGFGFPLFAPYMYQKLHYGWGNSLLGFLAIALGWPAPMLLWKYGELLRKKSTFAAG